MPYVRPSAWLCALTAASAAAQSNYTGSSNGSGTIVDIPYSYTYLLPEGFIGNVNGSFLNATTTGNATTDSALTAANQAPFIAYDPEFYEIFGQDSQISLIENRTAEDDLFAFEAGVRVPEKDEAWFSSAPYQAATMGSRISILNLNTSTVSTLNTSGPTSLQYPNGGYYFQGKVYFATYPSNTTYRGGIYSVDVQTHQVEAVVNSYFGLPFNSVDDLVWVTKGNDKYLYFTDYPYSYSAWGDFAPPNQLPSGVWRWDPQSSVLQQVISRNDIGGPNGLRISPDQRTLYVTEGEPTYFAAMPSVNTGGGSSSWLGPYIYQYDLDENMYPVNRRVFALVREYIADGLHVDDKGRVWGAEGEGIVIRRPKDGKVLGLVNRQYFTTSPDAEPIANFALAGDKLVVGAGTQLWTVQLNEEVVSRNSVIAN